LKDFTFWLNALLCVAVLLEAIRLGRLLRVGLSTEERIDKLHLPYGKNLNCLVSIVVPAKDEVGNLERTVRSILDSNYSTFELFLVNDRSKDGTLALMRQFADQDQRIRIVSIDKLPDGWTGKTHALYEACRQVSGNILLFTDADVVWRKDTLDRTLGYMLSRDLDMLSLLPGFISRGFIENVVNPHLSLGFMYCHPIMEVNDPAKKSAVSSGAFIMIWKNIYDEVGSWKRFRNEITEDVALSKAVKSAGFNLKVLRARSLVLTEAFGSISGVCSFWKRTMYGGLEKNIRLLMRLCFNYLVLSALSILWAMNCIKCFTGIPSECDIILLVLSSAALASVLIPFGLFLADEGQSRLYSLAAPVGFFISAWVVLSCLWAVLSGRGIAWRSQIYR